MCQVGVVRVDPHRAAGGPIPDTRCYEIVGSKRPCAVSFRPMCRESRRFARSTRIPLDKVVVSHIRRFRQRTSIVVIAMLCTGCSTNPRSLCESLVPRSWTYLPQAPRGSAGLESSLPVTPSDGLKLVMTGFCAMSRCDRDANNFRANRRYHRMFEVRPLFNYTPSYARLAFSRL